MLVSIWSDTNVGIICCCEFLVFHMAKKKRWGLLFHMWRHVAFQVLNCMMSIYNTNIWINGVGTNIDTTILQVLVKSALILRTDCVSIPALILHWMHYPEFTLYLLHSSIYSALKTNPLQSMREFMLPPQGGGTTICQNYTWFYWTPEQKDHTAPAGK